MMMQGRAIEFGVCLYSFVYELTVCVLLWRIQGTTYVANAGDSRAIIGICEKGGLAVEDLSHDQKPDTPAEMRRIKKASANFI